MHGIHTHIPETNHVPSGYTVAAILSLLFMLPLFLVPASKDMEAVRRAAPEDYVMI
jgi:hypothetical protein